jgi:hypothetical protein
MTLHVTIRRIFIRIPQIINFLSSCIQLTEQVISAYARILSSQVHVRCRSHLRYSRPFRDDRLVSVYK